MAARKILERLRPLLMWLGFGGAAASVAVALLTVGLLGQNVVMIAPFDESTVELNRALYSPGEQVAELYGNPLGTPVRVIAPRRQTIIRPAEEPSLVLMRVNKQRGENPLQAQTIWFFGRLVVPSLIVLGIVGLILPRRRTDPIILSRP